MRTCSRQETVAMVEGRHAAALQEGGRAAGVDLDDALDGRAQRARRLQPADAPARHRPVLGEGVGEQQLLLVLADVEEGGRARFAALAVVEARIDLVAEDPQAALAADVADGDQLLAASPSSPPDWRAS